MSVYAQHDQAAAYGSDPSGNYAGGYGAANAYPPDPSQHPAGANPYAQNPSHQQPPAGEYGGPQKPQTNQVNHHDGLDPSGKQGQEDEHEHGHEEEEHAANGYPPAKPMSAGEKRINPVKKGQGSSIYDQDPHHHRLMNHYGKAAEHGVTVDHLKSFVHLASLGLAMLSHHLGMTEGHEDEEELKEEAKN